MTLHARHSAVLERLPQLSATELQFIPPQIGNATRRLRAGDRFWSISPAQPRFDQARAQYQRHSRRDRHAHAKMPRCAPGRSRVQLILVNTECSQALYSNHMTDGEKFQLVARTLRERAALAASDCLRAEAQSLAQHFDQLASTADAEQTAMLKPA